MLNYKIIDKPCASVDVLPTVLNLLGIEFDARYASEYYLEQMIEEVENRLYISDLMIDKDYFSFVYGKRGNNLIYS